MIAVPQELMSGFVDLLRVQGIPPELVEHYQKWLRYYFDFSSKYLNEQDQMLKVKLFLDKLKSKGQSHVQCQQAAHAVTIFFELSAQNPSPRKEDENKMSSDDDESPVAPNQFADHLVPLRGVGFFLVAGDVSHGCRRRSTWRCARRRSPSG